MEYSKHNLGGGKWVICEAGKDYTKPIKACTFAFDTETQVFLNGKLYTEKVLFNKLKKMETAEKRKRLSNITWAWQCYDEANGFFMTNDFETWLTYQCLCGYKYGWCYNSTFDFAQIDYQILALGKDKWHKHERAEEGKAYNKAQPCTYESLHSDMGARYAYKLWRPYKNSSRHTYVHAVTYHDFMKLIPGGLGKLLADLNVVDNEGNPVRKLSMEYQLVHTDLNISDADIDYCCNDVKGLYFAIKMFNETIEEQSNNECHIFGNDTNIMTAGGFAKRELLRSLYPAIKGNKKRLERYQKQHPISNDFDAYVREHHLYRGGISYVNELYKGLLLTAKQMNSPMYRYDVNSEYPYSMAMINDLIGYAKRVNYADFVKMKDKEQYEAAYLLTYVSGIVKHNYLGLWYDPYKRKYVDIIEEDNVEHLMFEREINEMSYWYDDFEFACDYVFLWKKGEKVYAPFVHENYALKAQAKKDKNATLQAVTKLKLNSSYGKLAERVERVTGYYELNEETGAIHFVRNNEIETSTSNMSVAVGALVTSYARCYILSKIREVCGDDIKHKFVYIDTDSIHAFASYDKADAFSLGGLKLEATCEAIKYILPKTYVDIEHINKDNTIDMKAIEMHSKGVNIQSIRNYLNKKQKGKRRGLPTLELINKAFSYGQQYNCLCAMNVRGGKVLVPTPKYLARTELAPIDNDERAVYSNYEMEYYHEI